MKKLILESHLSPGDLLMMTAAVRDLHRAYPGEFITDVRTSCSALWEQNPYVTRLPEDLNEVHRIQCGYPLIQKSAHSSKHFIHGYIEDLNEQLSLEIKLTEFKGDIHLSASESSTRSPLEERTGVTAPYWLLVAGGKYDFTTKWWGASRFQEVVDHFQNRILFVQVGQLEHHHPPLNGVIDLRGATSIRDLIRWTYHSVGVLCPITFLMHLAAAVPLPQCSSWPRSRACVVIAGGREPPGWEAYSTHKFLHSLGTLPCCDAQACWRSRTVPLGDGDSKDEEQNLCLDVVNGRPRCMENISLQEVVDAIEAYYAHPARQWLTRTQCERIRPFLALSLREQLGLSPGKHERT